MEPTKWWNTYYLTSMKISKCWPNKNGKRFKIPAVIVKYVWKINKNQQETNNEQPWKNENIVRYTMKHKTPENQSNTMNSTWKNEMQWNAMNISEEKTMNTLIEVKTNKKHSKKQCKRVTKLGKLSKIKKHNENMKTRRSNIEKTTKRQRNTLKKNKETMMNHILY